METQSIAVVVRDANRSAVARKIGISLPGVSRILSGDRVARSTNLSAVALELGVPMDGLYAHLMELRRKRERARKNRDSRKSKSKVA